MSKVVESSPTTRHEGHSKLVLKVNDEGIIERGDWLSITPIEIDTNTHLEAITLGRGRKMFLAQTKIDRKEGKAEKEAIRLAAIHEAHLLKSVCCDEKLELLNE